MSFSHMRFGGHSVHRPPKKCSVCRKPLTSIQAGIPWREKEARKDEVCQCPRCLCNIMAGDREPKDCDECAARLKALSKEQERDGEEDR